MKNYAGFAIAVCIVAFVFQACVEYCTPECTDKCCGPDGCGDTCSDRCPDGYSCNTNTCECESESECPPGQVQCGNDCTDLSRNQSHCGVCYNACPNGEFCFGGDCVPCQDECNEGEKRCAPGTTNMFQACGDPDNDTCNEWMAAQSCPAGDTCHDGICQVPVFTADVGLFASGRGSDGRPNEPIAGITVKALDNVTGNPIAGMESVSNSNGIVVFNGLPAGQVGFHAVSVQGDFVDTYQFNIDSNSTDAVLWVMDFNTYTAAPMIAGVTVEPNKGLAVGVVYWEDTPGCMYPVGCSTIKTNPESGDVRYFADNDMPTNTLANDPVSGRDDVNPLNGYWLIANVDPGAVSIGGYMSDQLLESTSCVMFADSVCIGDIVVGGSSNPQPGTCLPESESVYCP